MAWARRTSGDVFADVPQSRLVVQRVALSKSKGAVLGFTLVAGLGIELIAADKDTVAAGADLAAGWMLLASGAVAWERRPQSRTGVLLVATGAAWFLGTAFPPGTYLHRALLVHTILSYPTGRLTSRPAQAVVPAAYVAALEPLGSSDAVTLALGGAVVSVAALDLWRTSGPLRPARRIELAAAAMYVSILTIGALGRANGWDADRSVLLAYDAVVAIVGVVLASELARARWADAVVAGLIVDLGALEETGTLRGRLARALGDPSLELGYLLEDGSLVDDAGRRLALPRPGSNRRVTPIDQGSERLAVLIHDDAITADALLVESVAAAARITIVNARLQAESRARADALAASRLRISIAVDEQRRRIERELRLGTAARLDTVAGLVADARHGGADREDIVALERELAAARAELSALARGLYPAALSERGLVAALEDLALRSPIPVTLSARIGALEPGIEAAVYFTCAESLANVAKHASASKVTITVDEEEADLVVTIVDDGVGGARLGAGSGLQGLVDRVEAIGGRLRIESRPGAGTRLTVIVPAAFSAPVGTA